ncbi:MAG TPA: hypothetical protein VH088_15315 [Terriglobales bacterium]|nr:hypothetical protein [Terriglobales bacterium]
MSPKTERNYKSQRISPKTDADVLIAALDSVFRSKSRTRMFAIARAKTRRGVADDMLLRDMLAAMDLLEKGFLPRE